MKLKPLHATIYAYKSAGTDFKSLFIIGWLAGLLLIGTLLLAEFSFFVAELFFFYDPEKARLAQKMLSGLSLCLYYPSVSIILAGFIQYFLGHRNIFQIMPVKRGIERRALFQLSGYCRLNRTFIFVLIWLVIISSVRALAEYLLQQVYQSYALSRMKDMSYILDDFDLYFFYSLKSGITLVSEFIYVLLLSYTFIFIMHISDKREQHPKIGIGRIWAYMRKNVLRLPLTTALIFTPYYIVKIAHPYVFGINYTGYGYMLAVMHFIGLSLLWVFVMAVYTGLICTIYRTLTDKNQALS